MSTIEKAINKLKAKSSPVSQEKTVVRHKVQVSEGDIALPWDILKGKGMITPGDGRSQIAEELRTIKRPILKNAFADFHNDGNSQNLVMVTSSAPGEGKSYTSINLAISIAMELDKTALLVDADVARPSIANYLGFSAKKGLVDYLLEGDLSLSSLMIKTDLPRLSILPAGRQHHYSTELLASDNMQILLKELASRYHDRVIIFDSPPLLATSESQVLANQMGQVILVVEAVRTTQQMLKDALSTIPQANITGLILNKSRVKTGGNQYGYHYYGSEPKEL